MTLRALVVDDEPPGRVAVVRLLRADPEIELAGQCENGKEAVAEIRTGRLDLVFLDVQMPEMNGIEVVRKVGVERMPATVFVTAYEDYAVRAFDAYAVDYLLKPLSRERFVEALKRAKARIAGNSGCEALRNALSAFGHAATRYAERIPVTHGGRVTFVDPAEIDWIEARGNYTRIYVASKPIEVRETLSAIEQKLDPWIFVRIHRSTIVNVRRIREIHRWFNGHHVVVLTSGKELRMSRYQHDAACRLGID